MNKPCTLCSNEREQVFTATLLKQHSVRYFYCDSCGLLQTEEPHWLEEAYEDAIADEDTGLIARNQGLARKLTSALYFCFDRNGQFVDSAGGYGLLTRMMRDIGFDFYWHDEYCQNLFARGFEAESVSGDCCAVTAFEVLEHVTNPLEFLSDTIARYRCPTLILSTELFEGRPPSPDSWWYYTLATGQHISFYQRRTLELIAKNLSMRFYSYRNIHILTKATISPAAFRFLTGPASFLTYGWARLRMTSRTMADHKLISDRR